MDASTHPGDPKTTYLYNLGGQHGHIRYNSITAFAATIRKLYVEGNNLLAFTNNLQQTERDYFEKLGFTSVKDPSVPRMQTHYASAEVASKFLDNDFFVAAELEAKKKSEEAKEAKEARRIAILNGTLRNKDGSLPRRRGEFRVGDPVYRYLHKGRWNYNYVVSATHPNGEITINGHTFTPVVSNGNNMCNIQRQNRGW